MDLDEQGPQVAHALPQRRPGIAQRIGDRRIAAARRVRRQRRKAEGDAGEVLDDAVVEVGRDPLALARGGFDRVLEQRSRSRMAPLQAPGHRPGQGRLEQQQHSRPPISGGASVRSSRSALWLTDSKRW